MNEKPILFNTEMVSMILSGRKTQTRRVIKPHNPVRAKMDGYKQGRGLWFSETRDNTADNWYIKDYTVSPCWISDRNYIKLYAPYKPGDMLWVRETFATWSRTYGSTPRIVYRADVDPGDKIDYEWFPSIHMPRDIARIYLRVKSVRAERVQEISPEDCVAEGCDADMLSGVGPEFTRGVFNGIWDSTIKKSDIPLYGWDANPWVWVVEFERIKDGGDGDAQPPETA